MSCLDVLAQEGLQLAHVEHGVGGGDRAVHHPPRLHLSNRAYNYTPVYMSPSHGDH